MTKYIDAEKLIKFKEALADIIVSSQGICTYQGCKDIAEREASLLISTLQQEQPEVDLEKLGEIARHIIAVKQNVEDIRLSEDEWSLLERIGYPKRLNARKEESVGVAESPLKTFPRVNEFDCGSSYRH